MNIHSPVTDDFREELQELLTASLRGDIAPEQAGRLLELIQKDDAETLDLYLNLVFESSILLTWARCGGPEDNATEVHMQSDQEDAAGDLTAEASSILPLNAAVLLSPVTPSSPPPGLLSNAYHGTVEFFSQDIPFSLLAAAVICGLGLLVGSVTYVTHYTQLAQTRPNSEKRQRSESPSEKIEYVGLVTGAVDVKWANPEEAPISNYVVLGRTYEIASGLLELTYDTGAKVILQGPAAYEVESANGGYMSVGKLTGKVETERAKGFCVRTPRVVVTDLGTEFGVEVSKDGAMQSVVYQGKVDLRIIGYHGKSTSQAVSLGENESARVTFDKSMGVVVVRNNVANPSNTFVRELPRRVPIELFNTGVGLKEGDIDPHWQIVARSDDPNFKPGPAIVVRLGHRLPYVPNDPSHPQWISNVGDLFLPEAALPGNVTYTFRTTFDMDGMRPNTARMRIRFCADNFVSAIRINGCKAPLLPRQEKGPPFMAGTYSVAVASGFVEGANVLEIDVENYDDEYPDALNWASTIALQVELEGFAFPSM